MERIPSKPTLPELVLARLRSGIEEGEWSGRLPPERELSGMLQVSRPTLRLALEQLKDEGWIAVEGRITRILRARRKRGRDAMRTRVIVFLSPVPLERLSYTGLVLYGELGRRLTDLGATIRLASSPVLGRPNVGAYLERLRNESRADGWILYRTTAEVQRHFQQSTVPAVVLGNAHRGIELPALKVDYPAALRHGLAALRRLRHDPLRILLVLPDTGLAGNLEVEAAFLEETGIAGAGQVLRHSETVENLPSLFEGAMLRMPRPSAAIVLRTSAAMMLHGLAAHRFGLAIPKNLSILCLDDAPFMVHLVPAISRYRIETRRIAQFVFSSLSRQLASGIRKGWENRPLIPEFMGGDTLSGPS